MNMRRDDLGWVQEVQADAEEISFEVEATTGMDRREFVFRSVVAAAATAFGVGVPAVAGAPGAAQARPSPPPPFPLGNGEPPAVQFQPYPGGTGAFLEGLVKEHGVGAFRGSKFNVLAWRGKAPETEEDLAFLPAHRLSALLRARKITSRGLTEIYLGRLKRLDPQLRCVVTLTEDRARSEADLADAELDRGRWRGPLHGLPYGLKDLFSTAGVRTTWGAADFEHRMIEEDAEIVVRLREAGAVLVAKLATGLFAMNDQWYRGRTNNPWNLAQGSSGSSAGPASATAAGCVAFAIGTETQGSIVSPALRCGISALRPTFGRVSRHGGMVLAWSMDRVGPMGRSVEDCAMVFNAIHGMDEKDPSTVTAPFRFERGIDLSSLRIGIDPNAPRELVEVLRGLGMRPREIGARPAVAGMRSGLDAEGAAAFDEYVRRKAREIGLDLDAPRESNPANASNPPTAGVTSARAAETPNPMAPADWNPRFVTGRRMTALDYVQSQRRRQVLIRRWAEFMKDLDLFIASPTADIGANAQTGHPCVVLPYRFDAPEAGRGGQGGRNGGGPDAAALNPQPLCAVITGGLFRDDAILSVAHRFQAVTDFHLRRPRL